MLKMSCAGELTTKDKSKNKIITFVSLMEKKGIRLVALDFDQTLITIHSGGVWKDSTDKLLEHVRPCIKDLMEISMQHGLHVCIVTYFMQPWVIREMLTSLFKKDAAKIQVQANTLDFREKHKHQFLGKEAHISAVCTELYNQRHSIIKPQEIILFDDDEDNIKTAEEFGHWAFEVKEDISYDSFEDFYHIMKAKKVKQPK